MKLGRQLTQETVEAQLEEAGVSPTSQRVEIARIMLSQPQHMSAEDVLVALRKAGAAASKATVYNTLRLFAQCGLLRTVIVDPTKAEWGSRVSWTSSAGKSVSVLASRKARLWMGWISLCGCVEAGPQNNDSRSCETMLDPRYLYPQAMTVRQ